MPLLAVVVGIMLILAGFFVAFPFNIFCWILGGLVLLWAFTGPRSATGRRWW